MLLAMRAIFRVTLAADARMLLLVGFGGHKPNNYCPRKHEGPCEAGDEVCDCDDHAAASNHMNQVCPSDPGQHHSNHRCGGVTETGEFPQPLRNSSGNLAIFAAIRRALSLLSSLAASAAGR